MSMELCVLASGSSGNASLLKTPGGCLLVDAGIGPRSIAKRLTGTGVAVTDVKGIVLTHGDSDHFTPTWVASIVKLGLKVWAFTPLARRLAFRFPALREALVEFRATDFSPVDGVTFKPLPFAHDESGSHGFLISAGEIRIGYATDLGRVPPHLLEAFSELDILAIEANYDPQMQMASSRPWFLKQRIMGGAGHLSNQQALDAVKLILSRHEARGMALPSHIVLLHRSRDCNCPNLLRRFFSQDPRIERRLTLTHQAERTDWLKVLPRDPAPNEQLAIAFG